VTRSAAVFIADSSSDGTVLKCWPISPGVADLLIAAWIPLTLKFTPNRRAASLASAGQVQFFGSDARKIASSAACSAVSRGATGMVGLGLVMVRHIRHQTRGFFVVLGFLKRNPYLMHILCTIVFYPAGVNKGIHHSLQAVIEVSACPPPLAAANDYLDSSRPVGDSKTNFQQHYRNILPLRVSP
jgi:hypothetical protein